MQLTFVNEYEVVMKEYYFGFLGAFASLRETLLISVPSLAKIMSG